MCWFWVNFYLPDNLKFTCQLDLPVLQNLDRVNFCRTSRVPAIEPGLGAGSKWASWAGITGALLAFLASCSTVAQKQPEDREFFQEVLSEKSILLVEGGTFVIQMQVWQCCVASVTENNHWASLIDSIPHALPCHSFGHSRFCLYCTHSSLMAEQVTQTFLSFAPPQMCGVTLTPNTCWSPPRSHFLPSPPMRWAGTPALPSFDNALGWPYIARQLVPTLTWWTMVRFAIKLLFWPQLLGS